MLQALDAVQEPVPEGLERESKAGNELQNNTVRPHSRLTLFFPRKRLDWSAPLFSKRIKVDFTARLLSMDFDTAVFC